MFQDLLAKLKYQPGGFIHSPTSTLGHKKGTYWRIVKTFLDADMIPSIVLSQGTHSIEEAKQEKRLTASGGRGYTEKEIDSWGWDYIPPTPDVEWPKNSYEIKFGKE